MAEHEDVTGEFARWLFCIAECPPAYIDLLGDDTDTGISEALNTLYQRLELLPEQDYLLTLDAKVVFQRYQHQLIDRTLAETHPGLKTAFPKFESYLARFCTVAALCQRRPSQRATRSIDPWLCNGTSLLVMRLLHWAVTLDLRIEQPTAAANRSVSKNQKLC